MTEPHRRGAGGQAGFTLLEVLVALVIAAFSLTLLYDTVSSSIAGVRVAGHYAEALSRARSHLAAIGKNTLPLLGRHEGDDGDGFHWRLDVAPVPGESDLSGIAVFACRIAISWQDGLTPRQVVLETRRLGTFPQRNSVRRRL